LKNLAALILAAGMGTRMKSDRPKVLHEILGRPMISYLLDSIKAAGIDEIVVVAGYESAQLREALKGADIEIVIQKELMGSGDAVNAAKRLVEKRFEDMLVVCGDTPLIRVETLEALIRKHKDTLASATIMTAEVKDPTGYGRILREDEKVIRIVEEEEASLFEEVINEINVGTYCFKTKDLFAALAQVMSDNKKKEYYLTDVVGILYRERKPVEAVVAEDEGEIIGVNTRIDLAEAARHMKDRILKKMMLSGVTIADPASTTIYPDVRIGRESVIYPNTIIESDVEIGRGCRIGPFARIRGGVILRDAVEIGNFVELVRTEVGESAKIKHHTYLGDTVVGKDANIGAGTITANFDGRRKNKTVIEDGAFIGVGSILIAPVKVGRKATVGAGSVVTKNHDVPAGKTVIGTPARILKKR